MREMVRSHEEVLAERQYPPGKSGNYCHFWIRGGLTRAVSNRFTKNRDFCLSQTTIVTKVAAIWPISDALIRPRKERGSQLSKRKSSRWALGVVSTLTCCGTCFGFQLAVQINSVPATTDKIFILADGEGLTVPVGSISRVPSNASQVTLWIPTVSIEPFRLRAIAFTGKSLFPTVSAIGVTTHGTRQGAPVAITMGWSTPVVKRMADSDGTTTLLVAFGDIDFFHRADAAELWIDSSPSRHNCTGTLYLAPLFKTKTQWYALFLIPSRLLSPDALIQLAYHALDFRAAEQVPLLVWPNRDQNEPPLQIMSPIAQRASWRSTFGDQRVQAAACGAINTDGQPLSRKGSTNCRSASE